MSITIDVQSEGDVDAAIEQAIGQIVTQLQEGELEPMLRDEMEPALCQWHYEYFTSESAPDGSKWAPLAARTLAEKRRKGYPDDILVRTGEMRKQLSAIGQGVRDIGSTGPDMAWLTFGTSVEYAGYHMTGTLDPPMPARPHTGLNDQKCTQLAEMVADYVVGFAEE